MVRSTYWFVTLPIYCLSVTAHAGGHLLHTFDDPTPSNLSYFGSAVEIDSDNVFIASTGGSGLGARPAQAHLFDASSGALLRTFADPTSPQSNGIDISVAIDGGYVVIGTETDNEVHLFDTSSGAHLRTFSPNFGHSGYFGSSVAISGSQLLVGASPFVSSFHSDLGEAYLFDATNGDLLHHFRDPTMLDGDHFGQSVAIDGGYLVIGSRGNNDVGTGVGQVHLYDTNTGGLLRTLEDPHPSRPGSFGSLVAIDGSHVLVGGGFAQAEGRFIEQTYLFDILTGGLLETFVQPAGSDVSSIAIDGSRVLIGGTGLTGQLSVSTSQAHLFDAGSGELLEVFTEPTPKVFDTFGTTVAVSGNRVVVGVPTDLTNGFSAGRSHLFSIAEIEGPIAGDFDRDGDIDFTDYEVWESAYGSTEPLFADANDDGVVNAADYTRWRDAYNDLADPIPEPTTMVMVFMNAVLITISERKVQ